jgi:carbon monoxide dehydrogenase subunit G
MATIETSISIKKPVEKVFEFLTNVGNQKSLNPAISEVTVSGKVAVGTRYTVKSKYGAREFSSENEIVALVPNKTFAVKTLAPPPASDVTNTYTLESEGAGTKLHLSMDAVVMPGTEGMVVPQLRAGLDTALAAIKKQLDG